MLEYHPYLDWDQRQVQVANALTTLIAFCMDVTHVSL